MSSIDIPDKLWSIGNIITGFAIAQTVIYFFALGNLQFAEAVGSGFIPLLVAAAVTGVNAVLITVVWWCHRTSVGWIRAFGNDDRKAAHFSHVSHRTAVGRTVALAVSGVLAAIPAFFVDGHL